MKVANRKEVGSIIVVFSFVNLKKYHDEDEGYF